MVFRSRKYSSKNILQKDDFWRCKRIVLDKEANKLIILKTSNRDDLENNTRVNQKNYLEGSKF